MKNLLLLFITCFLLFQSSDVNGQSLILNTIWFEHLNDYPIDKSEIISKHIKKITVKDSKMLRPNLNDDSFQEANNSFKEVMEYSYDSSGKLILYNYQINGSIGIKELYIYKQNILREGHSYGPYMLYLPKEQLKPKTSWEIKYNKKYQINSLISFYIDKNKKRKKSDILNITYDQKGNIIKINRLFKGSLIRKTKIEYYENDKKAVVITLNLSTTTGLPKNHIDTGIYFYDSSINDYVKEKYFFNSYKDYILLFNGTLFKFMLYSNPNDTLEKDYILIEYDSLERIRVEKHFSYKRNLKYDSLHTISWIKLFLNDSTDYCDCKTYWKYRGIEHQYKNGLITSEITNSEDYITDYKTPINDKEIYDLLSKVFPRKHLITEKKKYFYEFY